MGAGKRRAAVDPFHFATLEQVGEVVGIGPLTFDLRAFRQQMDECTDGGAAEAVADEVDLLDLAVLIEFAPVRDIAGIGLAEPFVAVALGMDFAVVDAAALDEHIEFTGSVPHAGEHTDRRSVRDVAGIEQRCLGAAVPHAEQRADVIDAVVIAPAEVAVDQHERIVVGLSHNKISL